MLLTPRGHHNRNLFNSGNSNATLSSRLSPPSPRLGGGSPMSSIAVSRADVVDPTVERVSQAMDLCRADSMPIVNDPRFFNENIIDKRLAAFGHLNTVSGLMMGQAMKQLFHLKKDMDFTHFHPGYGYIGYWQFVGFTLQMITAFMCMIALYTSSHQIFYTYRLMTSGPTGFELAAMFYLTKQVVVWRHFSVKVLLNGLLLFLFSSGITLFVKFIRDADHGARQIIVVDMHPGAPKLPTLDDNIHELIAMSTGILFFLCSCLLCHIRIEHLSAFRQLYQLAAGTTGPLTQTLLQMQHRNAGRTPVSV